MIKVFINKILGREVASSNDFSAFFRNASARDKKKLLKDVVREANNDQRAVIEKYERMVSKIAR